jgi:hypothetical protein
MDELIRRPLSTDPRKPVILVIAKVGRAGRSASHTVFPLWEILRP